MKKTLRKGVTYIDIQYNTGNFSNNLYCSSYLNLENNTKTLELDFSKINNSRIKDNSYDDLLYMIENSTEISVINFLNNQIAKRLILNGIEQNEMISVDFIGKEKITKKMEIFFLTLMPMPLNLSILKPSKLYNKTSHSFTTP